VSTKTKVILGVAAWIGLAVLLGALFPSEGSNDEFQPQNEYKLKPWVSLKLGPIDLSINRAVLYLFLACGATVFAMTWIARRMERKPNRTQMMLEVGYDLTRKNIAFGNMEDRIAVRWFPFVATLFFFIWFSNMIGYIPLPTNTQETINVFGAELPALAIYAATANLSIPLALTIVVWITYNVEGIRERGFLPYFRSWLPPGLEDMNPIGKGAIFAIEVVSHLVRLISLSVRLFANILAGHLLILFMAGGLAVLLGLAVLGLFTLPLAFIFFVFEVGLIATLQAFIFAILTAIYIGGATAESH